jgi:cyclopropane fatty-acyl-phospholipid synthase-like methyltransferase
LYIGPDLNALAMLRKFIASHLKKPSGLPGIFTSNFMIKNNQKNYDRLVKDLVIHPGDKLLEIGYGPGVGINMVAKLCPSCTIHGIDFSKLMYQRASNYNKEFIDDGRVDLRFGDFLESTFDSSYDIVFCLNVVYFWNELIPPFRKVWSILKEGGRFHIFMAHKNMLIEKKAPDSVFNKYSLEQVMEALHAAGFKSVEHMSDKGLYIEAKK